MKEERLHIFPNYFRVEDQKMVFNNTSKISPSPVISIRPNQMMIFIVTTFLGFGFGFLIGLSIPAFSVTQFGELLKGNGNLSSSTEAPNLNTSNKFCVTTNPQGAKRLPPGIVVSESDLYLHRLWGNPDKDVLIKHRYLVTFTVGYNQKLNIDAVVKKFSGNFTILLFDYDGRASEWNEFEWSKRAIHVSVEKQTKWWYAKRFLHPDIVATYEYIFIWDEDLDAQHFDAEEYIKLVRKHGLEISQPGLDPRSKGSTWEITRRRGDGHEVHKQSKERKGRCSSPIAPPCAGFVEIMAPVFSREAWRCVWYLIQNDLIHGWGLDFLFRMCVEPAHEKIGVVDAQWIIHQAVPSLGKQGNGRAPWKGVRKRCKMESAILMQRIKDAEKNKSYTC